MRQSLGLGPRLARSASSPVGIESFWCRGGCRGPEAGDEGVAVGDGAVGPGASLTSRYRLLRRERRISTSDSRDWRTGPRTQRVPSGTGGWPLKVRFPDSFRVCCCNGESNFIVNPNHPGFGAITAGPISDFRSMQGSRVEARSRAHSKIMSQQTDSLEASGLLFHGVRCIGFRSIAEANRVDVITGENPAAAEQPSVLPVR